MIGLGVSVLGVVFDPRTEIISTYIFLFADLPGLHNFNFSLCEEREWLLAPT